MTMFTAFTEQFRKQDICLFTECIGDVAPLATVSTATTALSTVGFSNGNADSTQTEQPLGILTMTLTSTTNAVAGIKPSIGLFPAAPISAGGNVNREFRVGRGEIDMEARVKASVSDANCIVTVGLCNPSDSAKPTIAAEFVGFYAWGGDSTWTAAFVTGSTTVRAVATTIPVASRYTVFRVFTSLKGDRHKVYADGKLIATFDGQLSTSSGILPSVELRNRNDAGVSNQTASIDYFMVKLKANR
jgi:hypothetical protein